jgi:adenine deaminase
MHRRRIPRPSSRVKDLVPPRDVARLLAVARGGAPADCVLSGARVLSVFTREWLDADVAIVDGVVAGVGTYDGDERIDLGGKYVVPGFIDAHMHFESTRLLPDEYAKQVLTQGTTTVVADPHEIANVLGTDGVEWFVDFCAGLPLDVFFMAPSSVPASPLESARDVLGLPELTAMLQLDRVLGVAEMMNFPGVIGGSEHELAKLRLAGSLHVDGHAPGVVGKDLAAYAAAGISTDHEACTAAEGRERLRAGMWLLIREASAARNLDELIPLLREFGPLARIAFCTDDREPDDLAADGHINGMVRRAVAAGVAPEDAIAAATIKPATCHGLRHLGAVAPGYQADLLVLDDLERFEPSVVVKRGRPIAERTRPLLPDWVQQSVRIQPVTRDSLTVSSNGGPIRVIGLIADQIVTESLVMRPTVVDGQAVSDPARDLAKIAVIERHHATGRAGLGFVHRSGLQRGALASTVAHDAHNIVVIGSSDDDMLAAVGRLVELQGGIVAVHDGQILAECALPVAGLLSNRAAEDVIAESGACSRAADSLGWTGSAPFMALSFLALSVIPALKITDRGLVDVVRASLVPLGVDDSVPAAAL